MKIARYSIIPLVLLFVCGAVYGQTPIKDALQPFIDRNEMPGIVSVLSNKGELTVDCVGWADVENKVPMTPDKMFWIASMTKQLTASCVLMLVEEGKLSLDDPIEKYLPEFKNVHVGERQKDGTILLRSPATKITVRHVLSHTSGSPFWTPIMDQFGADCMPLRLTASTAAQIPFICDPGTQYHYSDLGIDLGATILEVVSGKPYQEFIQERLLDPLEMKDTTFYPNEEQLSRLVKPYNIRSGKCVPETGETVAFRNNKYPIGDKVHRYPEAGGGLFSTPLDMIKFFQMIANKGVYNGKRILSEQSVETFATKQTGDRVRNNYSFGMRIEGDWFGHDGKWQTDGLANFKTNQARVYFIQITGRRSPTRGVWEKVSLEVLSK